MAPYALLSFTAVVVFVTDNIVLSEIITRLHLHEPQLLLPLVLQPVFALHRDVDVSARWDLQHLVVQGDRGRTHDNGPMFSPVLMTLVAETLTGFNVKPFHLVSVA